MKKENYIVSVFISIDSIQNFAQLLSYEKYMILFIFNITIVMYGYKILVTFSLNLISQNYGFNEPNYENAPF